MRFSCLISFLLLFCTFYHSQLPFSVLYFKRIKLEQANFHIFFFPLFFKNLQLLHEWLFISLHFTLFSILLIYAITLPSNKVKWIQIEIKLASNIPLYAFHLHFFLFFVTTQSCSCRKMQLKIVKIFLHFLLLQLLKISSFFFIQCNLFFVNQIWL
jgi:hypothetical protein